MSAAGPEFVLLTPPDAGSTPRAVLDECAASGMTLRHVFDAPAVMVALHEGATGVVVIDPQRIAWVDELAAAVRAYYPDVELRCYGRGEWRGEWRGDEPDAMRDAGRPVATSPPSAMPRDITSTADLLSDEEMAMLMSPLPGQEV